MGASTCRLVCVLVASFGVLLPARVARAADAQVIVHFGDVDPISEFKNPQPSDAVVNFTRASHFSHFDYGDYLNGGLSPFLLDYSGPDGLQVEHGVQVDATFGKPFSLGRLIYENGLTVGREATGVDLQVAFTVNKPGVGQSITIMTLPLTIETFRVDLGFGIFGDGGRIGLPATFPQPIIELNGARYQLRVIGFGTIDAKGIVTTFSSLELTSEDIITLADLFAVLEPICDTTSGVIPTKGEIYGFSSLPGNTVCTKLTIGPRDAMWDRFGRRTVLEFQSGEKLEIICAAPGGDFQLMYSPSGGTTLGWVGICPWEGGCNDAQFYYLGGDDKAPGCLVKTVWRSRDYEENDRRPNPWTHENDTFETQLDWARQIFDAPHKKVITIDDKYTYNLGGTFVPMGFCATNVAGPPPEALPVDSRILSKDPPLGPELDAYFEAVLADLAKLPPVPMAEPGLLKRCDFNGDGRCDSGDALIFEAAVGTCQESGGYDPRADVDATGCVDALDHYYLFEVDRDGDGVPDAGDNCVIVPNHDQADTNHDGIGNACTPAVSGDLDGDGDIDVADVRIISLARNTAASGPTDPKDLDHDGRITVLDARKLVLLCTRPQCATQ